MKNMMHRQIPVTSVTILTYINVNTAFFIIASAGFLFVNYATVYVDKVNAVRSFFSSPFHSYACISIRCMTKWIICSSDESVGLLSLPRRRK